MTLQELDFVIVMVRAFVEFCNKNTISPKVIRTNFDRIKAMDAIDIAKALVNKQIISCKYCVYNDNKNCPGGRDGCIQGIMTWLERPVEEVHYDKN